MPKTHDKLLGAFRQLLCAACRSCSEFPQTKKSVRNSQLQQLRIWFGDDTKIEKILMNRTGKFNNFCILLPPLPKDDDGNILVLYAVWNFSVSDPWAQIEVAFERPGGDLFCYRFEMPSRPDGHAYPHAQNSQIFVRNPTPSQDCLARANGRPVNPHYPAFPIFVKNPVELLVCTFIAIYDRHIKRDIWDAIESKSVSIHIDQRIRDIIRNIEPS